MAWGRPFANGVLWRPLLTLAREKIHQYAKQHGLSYVEDESNHDVAFDRNFLRHEIFAGLQRRWPKVHAMFAQSAEYCAQALLLQDELAAIDLAACCRDVADHCLQISAWQRLSEARQHNVLRYFLRQKNLKVPSRKKLYALTQQMRHADQQRQPEIRFAHVIVRRYKDTMYFLSQGSLVQRTDALLANYEAEWDFTTPLVLPNHIGVLHVASKTLAATPTKVYVRFRRGGERMHPEQRCGSHPLKKLMQEWGIPPWSRGCIPLIFCNDILCIVPGYARASTAQKLELPELELEIEVGESRGPLNREG